MSTIARLTVDQYDRMIEANVFPPGPRRHRIELIDGELRMMSPIGPPHEVAVDALVEWSFLEGPGKQVVVRVQNSIGIPELDSVPEPDIAWVKRRSYRRRRPSSSHILLIIEVSDSSVEFEEGEKSDLYAAARIRDYWVVNIPEQCLRVHRQPRQGRYQSIETFHAPERVHPLAFPKVALPLELLFPQD